VVTTKTPAVDKAMLIFQHLSEKGRATFTEIQKGVGLPKSTASSLLASLLAHGLVKIERDRYSLGLLWYELGSKVEEELDIKKIAVPSLTRLRDTTMLTCHLGVLEGTAAIYVIKLESPTAIVIRSWIGRRLSLHSSGLGKALLAWLPDEQLERILVDIVLEPRTATTITDVTQLRDELTRTRQRGWAYDNAEDHDGVYCISAPIFDRSNGVIAAISTSGVSSQINGKTIPTLAKAVVATAREISLQYAKLPG